MAIVNRTTSQAWKQGVVDLEKVKATTEADIAGYMILEGEDPADPFGAYRQVRPAQGTPRPKRAAARKT